jgi:hypothetical protein
MWTEEERQIASSLLKNPETMAFLKKLYCPDRSAVRTEIETYIALPDEQLGQVMRSMIMAEKHFATQHANIAKIATKETTTRSPIAPK